MLPPPPLLITPPPGPYSSPEALQASLVHKCAGHNILHVAVDTAGGEGVVYLMAESVEVGGGECGGGVGGRDTTDASYYIIMLLLLVLI